jgi:lipid A 3-O-deacylase
MKLPLLVLLLFSGPVLGGVAGKSPTTPTVPASDPASLWAFDVEAGALRRVTNNTSLDYTVVPVMFSLRTPAHIRLDLGGGELTVRARFSLLTEAVAEGPESLYLGFSASPSVEYWFGQARRTCLYAGAGGGAGWIDSQGVPGGQGQDFTYNWFAAAGLRHYFTDHFSLNAGLLFQHWSNRGATDPNPGLDALGPVIGATWHF